MFKKPDQFHIPFSTHCGIGIMRWVCNGHGMSYCNWNPKPGGEENTGESLKYSDIRYI